MVGTQWDINNNVIVENVTKFQSVSFCISPNQRSRMIHDLRFGLESVKTDVSVTKKTMGDGTPKCILLEI